MGYCSPCGLWLLPSNDNCWLSRLSPYNSLFGSTLEVLCNSLLRIRFHDADDARNEWSQMGEENAKKRAKRDQILAWNKKSIHMSEQRGIWLPSIRLCVHQSVGRCLCVELAFHFSFFSFPLRRLTVRISNSRVSSIWSFCLCVVCPFDEKRKDRQNWSLTLESTHHILPSWTPKVMGCLLPDRIESLCSTILPSPSSFSLT